MYVRDRNKYEIIENTIDKISRKQTTKRVYRSHLKKYFRLLNIKNPNKYFEIKRDYIKDIWKVARLVEDEPLTSQQTFISTVKQFFKRNRINIPDIEFEDITKRNELSKAYTLTNDLIPTTQQLKELLNYSNQKTKTLIMFIKDTGCRIGETVRLNWNDIDLNNRIVWISAEISKTSRKRFTFFTLETQNLLEAWKSQLFTFFKEAVVKSEFMRQHLRNKGFTIEYVKPNKWNIKKDGKEFTKQDYFNYENRVFPFTEANASEMLKRLQKKAGPPFNEKDTNPKLASPRYRLHLHCFRKYFFNNFQSSGANKNHIDFIGGHQSLLDSIYTDFLNNPELLKKTYDDYSSCLSLYESDKKLIEINEKLEEKDKEIYDLHRRQIIQEELKKSEIEMIEQRLNDTLEKKLNELKNGKLNISKQMNEDKREKIYKLIAELWDV